jgi:hypothetical protein
MQINRRTLGVVGLAGLLGVTAFGLAYAFTGPDRETRAADGQQFPGEDVTPEPGSTPDFSTPLWYVPYQNAENAAPKFEGERNGVRITLDPDLRGDLACEGTFRIAPADKTLDHAVNSEIGIPLKTLPRGVIPSSGPNVFLCDEAPFHVTWTFDVEAGVEGVGAGGSSLEIFRLKGTNEFYRPASEGRWSEVEIGGHRGLLLRPIIVGPGAPIDGCMVAFRDEPNDLLTVVWATAGLPEFCISVAEVLS